MISKVVKFLHIEDLGNWIGGAVGVLIGLYGGLPVMLRLLIAAMIVDYCTGWCVALCGKSPKSETGKLSSKVGFVGILKKGVIIGFVYLATLLDNATGQAIYQQAVAAFYFANEGLSIIENLDLMGIPIPAFIKNVLEVMRNKNDVDTTNPAKANTGKTDPAKDGKPPDASA